VGFLHAGARRPGAQAGRAAYAILKVLVTVGDEHKDSLSRTALQDMRAGTFQEASVRAADHWELILQLDGERLLVSSIVLWVRNWVQARRQ
jgi:hypothetical protein